MVAFQWQVLSFSSAVVPGDPGWLARVAGSSRPRDPAVKAESAAGCSGQARHDLAVKVRVVRTVQQGIPGGLVKQGCLKYAGHHQSFALVQAEQALTINLRDLHGTS